MALKQNFEQYLIETQVLTPEVIKAAQAEALRGKITLFQLLIEKKHLTSEALAQVLARFHGIEYRPGPLQYNTQLVQKFPAFTLRRYKILPLSQDEKEIVVAAVDPGNVLGLDEIKRLVKINMKVVCTTESAINEALARLQGAGSSNPSSQTGAPLVKAPASNPIPGGANVVNVATATSDQADLAILHAIERAASDIHIEPNKTGGLIRERIDGVLYDATQLTSELITPLISRIKLLAGMDIVEKRLAQDGRLKFKHKGGECEIRASILPTIYGEKLVMRLLRNDRLDPTLEVLDMGKERMELMKKICDFPDGLVIVAGPTGSGKSTTIFAMLRSIDRKTMNVITVEDPVEYELEHASQVQVNHKVGITFSSTLPHILRQDPDVIMIGEVRDEETAQMVMRSAISGHLVFSTIHAPGAIDTVLRLIDMKVEVHMVTAALKACVSQRLLRKLCSKCKKGYPATPADKKSLRVDPTKEYTLFKQTGCEGCHQLGYVGRLSVVEILFITPAIQEAIVRNERKAILDIAKAEGFKGFFEHGVERVLAGDTTLTELMTNCSVNS